MDTLRFRQIHLDFHTSPFIPGIGKAFDKAHWQATLQQARVDSITCFASCCHGWSYHPTDVGQMHPHLEFDLLRAQMDACKEINVNVPVYLTAGFNNLAAEMHPEWREVDVTGRYQGRPPLSPGFKKMCFNTPYLDYLCDMIRETVRLFPQADGVFLDIIKQGACCCQECLDGMRKEGFDPNEEKDRRQFAEQVLVNYYRRTTEAVRHLDAKMPVFHNSGRIPDGHTPRLSCFSHLELESLPTGGWGYDHFPLSAARVRKLDRDFLGMTGKFHTSWGEFGGFKHPNALRYECAAMLAQGAKCSIGDQLHPAGQLDETTYQLIGQAYTEVEAKEPWCREIESAAQIAVLSQSAVDPAAGQGQDGDIGASRLLLENHLPFDLLDATMDFDGYRVLVLPDTLRLHNELATRLSAFLRKGGKLILSGESGLRAEGEGFAVELPVRHEGVSPYIPDFWLPAAEFRPDFLSTPFVQYAHSQRIRVESGTSLGDIYYPYFNREGDHFCSHQHAPCRPEASGYQAGVMTGQILYFVHPVFKLYRAYGMTLLKDVVMRTIRKFLHDDIQVETNLPSQARVTLMRQPKDNRMILHLLYAQTILRGGHLEMSGAHLQASSPVEVIEELPVLNDVEVRLRPGAEVTSARLEPNGEPLNMHLEGNQLILCLPRLQCHQMVSLQLESDLKNPQAFKNEKSG